VEEAQQLLERDAQAGPELQEGSHQVGDQRHSDLGHGRGLGGAQEGLDLQVRLDGLEEPLDLPPFLV